MFLIHNLKVGIKHLLETTCRQGTVKFDVDNEIMQPNEKMKYEQQWWLRKHLGRWWLFHHLMSSVEDFIYLQTKTDIFWGNML